MTSDLELYAKWIDDASGAIIYRPYTEHANTGAYHTTREDEYNNLPNAGWTQVGIAWYGLK